NSLRSSTKLVLILLLLLVEEGWLGFPGGSQVAFFATFFASTGNLGRQNKTDLVGLAGLLGGFVYGVVAAFFTSRLPHFPLLLAPAVSLTQLFGAPRATWEGVPPSLGETLTRARDLLDDARYLPGPEHADPAYNGILDCLQEIDANLEYVHFLVDLEEEHPLRQRFFQVIGDYPEQAQRNLTRVAGQFLWSPSRAARVEAVH